MQPLDSAGVEECEGVIKSPAVPTPKISISRYSHVDLFRIGGIAIRVKSTYPIEVVHPFLQSRVNIVGCVWAGRISFAIGPSSSLLSFYLKAQLIRKTVLPGQYDSILDRGVDMNVQLERFEFIMNTAINELLGQEDNLRVVVSILSDLKIPVPPTGSIRHIFCRD